MLNGLLQAILEEADRNPAFEERLRNVLSPEVKAPERNRKNVALDVHVSGGETTGARRDGGGVAVGKRPSNRRPPALVDPVKCAREGEGALRAALAPLTLDQLLDVVADYGMDTGKLVMKWRSPARVIDRIVELSMARAHKGDAFRDPSAGANEDKPSDR